MQPLILLLPTFLLIFSSISISFGVSKAVVCKLNDKDESKVAYTIAVDQSGQGNFTKIQDAIDSIPSGNDQWIRIHARQGIYSEKVVIPPEKPCILLEGESSRFTTITWGDHEQTDTSATFSCFADNFVAKRITFKNSYNHAIGPDYDERTQADASNYMIKQAVAARIYGDKSAFYQCGFMGFQDTLWDVKGRHYFNSCHIEGAVDFIFGYGQSLYEECAINVIAGSLPPQINAGYLTAQGRNSSDDPSGFIFRECLVFGTGQVYLGRAYGPYSRVIFAHTTFNVDVAPQGWDAWMSDFTYAEVNCQGPGSDTSKRVGWEKKLSAVELYQFTKPSFIDQDGWIANQP
ncbi:hypothetical protein L1049_020589 [Liquidambar formosana]|uniref:Pectinesterase n=1 Tax=Liquidambar formosana TaxID=63359 RepID=A0AAP0X488_LIQFO